MVGLAAGTTGCTMDESGVPPGQPVAAQLADPTPIPFDMDSSKVVVNGSELPLLRGQVVTNRQRQEGVEDLRRLVETKGTGHLPNRVAVAVTEADLPRQPLDVFVGRQATLRRSSRRN